MDFFSSIIYNIRYKLSDGSREDSVMINGGQAGPHHSPWQHIVGDVRRVSEGPLIELQ